MAKILILKEKNVFVEELGREVGVIKGKQFIVRDLTKDFSTTYGLIAKKDLKAKDGSIIKSNTGKEFIIYTAEFIDLYKRLKRAPQTVPLKDLGVVAAETGINKDSVVVEAGTGSGGATCFFAHLCKKVTSYDIKEDFQDVAQQNAKDLGLKNITFKLQDVADGIKEKDVDLVFYDLPEPWNAIEQAEKALRTGGWLVYYGITVPQLADFCNAIAKNDSFMITKSIEVSERLWKVKERVVRPKNISIGHSGFLTFVRKIK